MKAIIKSISIFFIGLILISCNDSFLKNADLLLINLNKMNYASSNVCSYYSNVWKNAIYNEEEYLDASSPYYLKDYNQALIIAKDTKYIKDEVAFIVKSKKKVDSLMKYISEHSIKNQALYDDLFELYAKSKELTSLALKPSGSLIYFDDKTNNLSYEIVNLSNRIKIELEAKKK